MATIFSVREGRRDGLVIAEDLIGGLTEATDEWGRPVTDDRLLFEKICLEGFQRG